MSDPYLGEIFLFPFNFAPKGFALCNGQLLPVNQNQALYSLLGTMYGGNGQTTFALPNLQGQVAVGAGNGGGDNYVVGQSGGAAMVALTQQQMPTHFHALSVRGAAPGVLNGNVGAPNKNLAEGLAIAGTGNQQVNLYGTGSPNQQMDLSAITNQGGGQPHDNMMPYLTLSYCIALQGIFPSRN